jgi:diguanylate cyclase (GGDEF)-like protein
MRDAAVCSTGISLERTLMPEHNSTPSRRTLLAGKVISNFGQSSIDCVVRQISGDGATIEVESAHTIPEQFHLLLSDEGVPRSCKRKWLSGKQLGLTFETVEAAKEDASIPLERRSNEQIARIQLLALRSALDEIEVGVVLLDGNMRSQFINRAFRRMWSLPDEIADRNPAFVALMYHGRDTKAYQTDAAKIDDYVANRVRLVRDGDTAPLDLRRSNGEIIRMQCAVLPNGGRMLSYTYVTDIVRHSDELERLRSALDNVSEGVVLLDADLNAQFVNRKMKAFWRITDEQVAAGPKYAWLITNAPDATDRSLPPDELAAFFAGRVAAVKAAESTIRDLKTPDGRHIRAHCTVLHNDGRMLTYCDISDIIRNSEQLERLATTDSMTGLYNRRHFLTLGEAEWSRFQRYHRPLSLLMLDIDHFKAVNDRYGHAVGDEAIISVANGCVDGKRESDIVGRLGGEEFAILLPETDLAQATIVANRLCMRIAANGLTAHKVHFKVTASIGVATASVSMSGLDVLIRAADQALYQAKAQGRNRTVQWSPPEVSKLAAE